MALATSFDASWERRLRVYPPLILGALALAFVFVIAAGSGSSTASGRVGGDFPAFYGAGTIVNDGDIDSLYDPATQAAAQVDLLGDEGGYIMYPYSPHVAAAYGPLAALPYRLAYVLHTSLMVGAFIGALALIRPMVPIVGRWFGATVGAVLTAYPVFVGVTGGQNTAISLLLLAATWRCWHEDRDGLAGVALAILLFRPQYALPLLGLALLDRRWRTVAVGAAGAAVVWAVNATLFGADWLTSWLRQVEPLLEADATINAVNEIAPIGVLQAILGAESLIAKGVGGAVSAGIALGFAWLWWRRPVGLTERMAITTAGLMLLGPHAIYYDTALLTFATLVLLDRRLIDGRVAVAIWAAGALHLTKNVFEVSPLILLIGAVLVGTARLLLRTEAQAADGSERVLPIQDSYSVAYDPGLGDQLVVRTDLHDLPGIEDDDEVGPFCGRQAVRDRDHGATAGQAVERGREGFFGLGVDG